MWLIIRVLLPKDWHIHFELGAMVWTLYEVPKRNAHNHNSGPGQIKLNTLWLWTKPLIIGLIVVKTYNRVLTIIARNQTTIMTNLYNTVLILINSQLKLFQALVRSSNNY